jgi:mono/diheme cytochrome c family protein
MFRSSVLVALGLALAACGSDSGSPGGDGDGGPGGGDGGGEPADAAPIEHTLMPAVAHSGFDGVSSYKVPVYTTLEDAAWDIGDQAVATIESVELPPDLEPVLGTFGKSWAMITTASAGTTTFYASADGVDLEASLVVLAYDDAVVAVGDQRYNTPENPNDTDRIACQDCHGAEGGVDHTPLAMAYRDDAELLQIISESEYPEGGMVLDGEHAWNLTEAEADGIVPYLRSLQPRGFE